MLTLAKTAASAAIQGAKWLWHPSRRKWVLGALTALLAIILINRYAANRVSTDRLNRDLETAHAETELYRDARAADDRALSTNVSTKAAIAVEDTYAQRKIEAALQDNPDWANQPIPRDVLDSLQR